MSETHSKQALPELHHRTVDVGEVRLHVVEAGSGPLIVLLHGFPEFWYTWRKVLPKLASEGFHVVAPDMRGYNLSDKPSGVAAYGTKNLAADIEGLVRALGAEKASIVGHDWGGGVAYSFAMAHPEHLDKLAVLNCPHPERMLHGLRDPRQLLRSYYMFLFQLPLLPERVLRKDNYGAVIRSLREEVRGPNALTAEDFDRYREAFAQPGALTAMVHYYRAAMRGMNQVKSRWIDAPVFVLWGDEDRHLDKKLAEPRRDLVPNVVVKHVADASHWIIHEKPDLVTAEIAAFLRG